MSIELFDKVKEMLQQIQESTSAPNLQCPCCGTVLRVKWSLVEEEGSETSEVQGEEKVPISIVTVPSDYKVPIPFDTSHIDLDAVYYLHGQPITEIILSMIRKMFSNPKNRCVAVRGGSSSKLLQVHSDSNRWENAEYKSVQVQVLLTMFVYVADVFHEYLINPTYSDTEVKEAMKKIQSTCNKMIYKIQEYEMEEVYKLLRKPYVADLMDVVRGWEWVTEMVLKVIFFKELCAVIVTN